MGDRDVLELSESSLATSRARPALASASTRSRSSPGDRGRGLGRRPARASQGSQTSAATTAATRLTTLTIGEREQREIDGSCGDSLRRMGWAKRRDAEDGETLETGTDGRSVTRRASGILRATYACEEEVLDVCWCEFGRGGVERTSTSGGGGDDASDGWYACALHRDSFTVFGISGETRRMPLGFEAASFAATCAGLLFVSLDGVVSIAAHALAEPTAIDGLDDATNPVRVAWSDARRSLVLFFVPTRGAHELWRLSLVSGGSETEFSESVPECRICADICWSERIREDFVPEATSYGFAHDEDGREMVLVSEDSARRVTGLYVSSTREGVRANAPIEGVFSAVGVSATRKSNGMLDTLVASSDGTLELYVGQSILCKIRVSDSIGNETLCDIDRVSDFLHGVATVRLHGQVSGALRVRVPGALASPHARALFAVLHEVCRTGELIEIIQRLYANDCVGVDDAENEWLCVVRTLNEWCGIGSNVNTNELSDWDFVQRALGNSGSSNLESETSSRVGIHTARTELVLATVHTVYEASKVDTIHRSMLGSLRYFAIALATAIDDWDYIDYYSRDAGKSIQPIRAEAKKRVPDILRAIEGIFSGEADFHALVPSLILDGLQEGSMIDMNTYGGDVVVRARRILKLCHTSTIDLASFSSTGGTFAHTMTAMGLTVEDVERLPPGLAQPFHGMLRCCRDVPTNGLSEEAYSLIGRHDLALMYGDVDLIRDAKQRQAQLATAKTQTDGSGVYDGLEHLEEFVGPLRFPRDYRIRELRALLNTASPAPIELSESEGTGGDAEQGSQQQAKLWVLATRTAALPVGRGAATLGTVVAKPTEALQTPVLCFAGCLPTQQNAVVNLDLTVADAPKNFTNWPEFHNGAASGLALRSDDDDGKLNRAWIVFNRPKVPTYSHAGVLMALGLNGHLSGLTATDLYRYLAQEHEATTVGTLLGVAASKLGTGDPATSRMCFLHIPTRHPLSFPEIELPSLVQSCALMSVGLLYQGTAQRLIVETLLSELGKSPEGDAINGRECYALSAGIALGLVTLGKGSSTSGLSDLLIVERLRHFTIGGIARYVPPPGGMPASSAVIKSTSANTSWNDNYNPEDGTFCAPEGPPVSVDGYILEGSMVNVDLSAPGAIMALTLMYLKTNDASVSTHLEIPSTHYALDDACPDYVMLRVVAKSLIMWDTIRADADWIESLLPPLLRDAMDPKSPEEQENQNDSSWLGKADREAIAQTYVNALAGGCMAIGLRYAGSGNAIAAATLRKYALKFLVWKKNAGLDAREQLVNKSTLETCIGVIAMSLACVMAGTGDLPTLRLLRHLRSRLETSAISNTGLTYGAHMAIAMANGFLFLGGCAQTFSTDNASVAALLIAMFPRFPAHPNDNRWYCQAYRHLYVLAAKERLLNTIDASTLEPVSTPLEITTSTSRDGVVRSQLITPCLLPDPDELIRIKVISPRYWTTDLDFERQPGTRRALYELRNIPIQRHTSALSYEVDRTGAKAQLGTALHAAGARAALKPPAVEATRDHNTAPVANATAVRAGKDAVDVFTSDTMLLSFEQSMCTGLNDRAGFSAAALRECMEREVPEALRCYVDMYAACENLIHSTNKSDDEMSAASMAVSDLRLMDAFHKLLKKSGGIDNGFPMPFLLTSSFKQSILFFLDEMYGTTDGLLATYLRGGGYDASSEPYGNFGCYLRLLDIPNPALLKFTIETALARTGATELTVPMFCKLLPQNVDPTTVLRIIDTCL